MKRTLIHYCGLLGIVSLISYTAAVFFSPLAYPGYNWMVQAVSDLSADSAPSRALWGQLSALGGSDYYSSQINRKTWRRDEDKKDVLIFYILK